jgi:hypothetical protein
LVPRGGPIGFYVIIGIVPSTKSGALPVIKPRVLWIYN